MAIAPLIVRIGTLGAAALTSTGLAFRRLAANVRVAAARMRNAFIASGGLSGSINRLGNRMRQLGNAVQQTTRALIGYIIASRVAQAASSALGRAITSSTFLLLAAKVALVAAAIVPLVGIIGNLLGAVQLIAPAIGTAALAFGVLKLATNGFNDAVGAGLSGDTKEFAEALRKLAPNAQAAAKAIVAVRDSYRGVQKAVQNNFFAGFAGDVQAVAAAFRPLAEKWLPRIASSFADMRHAVADVFFAFAKSPAGEAVFRNLSLAIDDILRSLAPLAQVFTDVLDVAAPRFQSLTSDAATLADKFAAWVREAKESGKLGEWLDTALETMGQIKEIGGNLIGIFQGIFRAGADDGKSFLQNLVGITEATERFFKSAQGQQLTDALGKIFQVLVASVPVWEFLIGLLMLSIDQFKVMGLVGAAAWDGAKAALSFFVGFAISSYDLILTAAVKAFGWIPGLGPKLKQAQADFREFAAKVNEQINGIQKTVTITIRARIIGGSLLSGAQQSGTYSSGIGGRASGGPVAAGQTVWVGERGKELVTFGGNGYVHDAATSRRMMGGGGGSSAGGGRMVLEIRSGGTGWDDVMVEALSRAVRVRGGNVQTVLGGR